MSVGVGGCMSVGVGVYNCILRTVQCTCVCVCSCMHAVCVRISIAMYPPPQTQ